MTGLKAGIGHVNIPPYNMQLMYLPKMEDGGGSDKPRNLQQVISYCFIKQLMAFEWATLNREDPPPAYVRIDCGTIGDEVLS